jgi:hypothetical protein
MVILLTTGTAVKETTTITGTRIRTRTIQARTVVTVSSTTIATHSVAITAEMKMEEAARVTETLIGTLRKIQAGTATEMKIALNSAKDQDAIRTAIAPIHHKDPVTDNNMNRKKSAGRPFSLPIFINKHKKLKKMPNKKTTNKTGKTMRGRTQSNGKSTSKKNTSTRSSKNQNTRKTSKQSENQFA